MDLQAGQHFDAGLQAYRSREYKTAVRHFQSALDFDPEDWNVMLYLAMSLYLAGDKYLAANKFNFLKENCPDAEIRQKAQAAYISIQGHYPLN
jgi:Flp pilus assembly protein TadD